MRQLLIIAKMGTPNYHLLKQTSFFFVHLLILHFKKIPLHKRTGKNSRWEGKFSILMGECRRPFDVAQILSHWHRSCVCLCRRTKFKPTAMWAGSEEEGKIWEWARGARRKLCFGKRKIKIYLIFISNWSTWKASYSAIYGEQTLTVRRRWESVSEHNMNPPQHKIICELSQYTRDCCWVQSTAQIHAHNEGPVTERKKGFLRTTTPKNSIENHRMCERNNKSLW